MGLISQNGISYIIIMGNLHLIEQDHILKFCRISHNGAFADNGISTDKSAMPDFRVLADDCRAMDICRLKYLG